MSAFFRKFLSTRPAPLPSKTFCAVIDTSNDTLACIGTHVQALEFIAETMMEGFFVPGIVPTSGIASIAHTDPRSYPEWTWVYAERAFKPTKPSVVTQELRDRSLLLSKKRDAITKVFGSAYYMRAKINRGIPLQETVYADKEREAKLFRDSGYDESITQQIPYVTQYADLYDIPLKQAADTIILKAQLDRDLLVKTERTRLSLQKKIREAKTPEEVETVISSFRATGAVL